MKAKFTLLLILSAVIFGQNIYAQNTFPATGSSGIGTTTPDASSILEVKSTTQGILIPRMTANQKNAIVSPALGLMVFQTNGASGFYYYDGSKWAAVSGKGATKSLGNLTSPTAVNADLLPGIDNTTNIGSVANSWKDAYFDGSIYLGGSRLLSYDVINGNTIIGPTALNNNTTGSNNTATGLKALYSNTTGHENMANGNNTLYSNTTGVSNTANGYNALYFNTTANYNTANGNFALYSNTTGATNTAIGSGALFSNTIGHDNSATGYNALSYNITGNYNTANGNYALYYNTTGSYNLANGYDALYSNTYGVNNTANGYNALSTNTTGYSNVANGNNALFSNTIGHDNSAVGNYALYSNTSGSFNTANGNNALYSNTTGNSNTANGYYALYYNTFSAANTANGYYALYSNNGSSNTANGYKTLYNNTSGDNNTGNGTYALYLNLTGSSNTANGYYALYTNKTGSSNTALGFNADVNGNNYSNTTVIGNYSLGTAINQVRIGNSSVTSIGGYVSWSNISDGRVKKNIKENVPGLDFINKLKPVTYNLDLDKADKIVQRLVIKDSSLNSGMDESKMLQEQNASRNAKMQIVYTGFIAQDVEKVARSLNYDFSGVDAPKNDKDLYGLRYAEFVVPLVKGEQELSKQNDSLMNIVTSLQQQINELKAMMVAGNQSSSNNTSQINKQTVELNAVATLSQNIPNPFSNSTTINYYLPVNNGNAYINFYGLNGAILKSIKLAGNGKGNINLKASELSSGAYRYTLFVDGKMIDSKQMVLAK